MFKRLIPIAIFLCTGTAFAQNGWTETQAGVTTTSGDNVGIGTSSPATFGALAVRKFVAINGKNVSASFSDAMLSTMDFRHMAGVTDISSENNALTFSAHPSQTDGTERMRITNAGNVGIGTADPASYGAFAVRKFVQISSKNVSASFSDAVLSTMDIRHLPGVADISAQNSALTFSTSPYYSDGAERMRVTNTGNVGIGTTAPAANDGTSRTLQIGDRYVFQDPVGSQGYVGLNAFYSGGPNWTYAVSAPAAGIRFSATAPGEISFHTAPSGSPGGTIDNVAWNTAKMVIQNDGSVTMAHGLTVNGTITGTQVVNAAYQDIAEWVPASEELAPGTVVVLDPDASNRVKASRTAYDTAVAGVNFG